MEHGKDLIDLAAGGSLPKVMVIGPRSVKTQVSVRTENHNSQDKPSDSVLWVTRSVQL